MAGPGERAAHPGAAGGQAEARPGLPGGDRLRRPAGAGQAARAPARHRPLGRRAPARAHHRRHRHREDVPRLRPGAPSLPARGTARCTGGSPGSSTRWPWPGPMGPTPASSPSWRAWTSWSSTTRARCPSRTRSGGTLLEVLEDRYGTRSTIVTSQVPVAQWHEASGIRPWRTRSATACFTTATDSC